MNNCTRCGRPSDVPDGDHYACRMSDDPEYRTAGYRRRPLTLEERRRDLGLGLLAYAVVAGVLLGLLAYWLNR